MKVARASATLGLVACAILASVPAAAEYSGWYDGLNLGAARAHIDDARIAAGLAQGGLTTTSITDDDLDFAGKVFGGYRFNPHFGLEAGYVGLGEFGFTAQTSPPGTLTGKVEMQGLYLDPVLFLPMTERLSAFARAGLIYGESKTTYSASGSVSAPPDSTKRAANYKFGAGLQYDFAGKPLSLRLEAERYRIDDAVGNVGDVDLLSLGVLYRFGRSAAHVAARRAARAAPVLVVVPAPEPVRMQKYCSILDIGFEINLDEIQREEKERLAVVGTFLKKYPDSTAVIEGHTDDVGSVEDNMALSQRRAESVVSYLVDANHIAPSRLQAIGYGETRPIADNDTEEGKRQNRRIDAVIACASDIAGLTVKQARITVAMEMEFDLNQTTVRPQYRDELGEVAAFLKANPGVTANVEGHTANLQGTADEGMRLSSARAQSVVDYLVQNFDVPRARLTAEGFGQTRRFSYNTSTEGQKENRRVNIILNYPRSAPTIGAN